MLERLYYKGKNQHRTALFWQRVAEMRKFGERVDEWTMSWRASGFPSGASLLGGREYYLRTYLRSPTRDTCGLLNTDDERSVDALP